jgi:hypothetical protein
LDENNRVRFRFFPEQSKRGLFSDHINVVYDPAEERIVSHICSDCPDEDACRHFLSLLYYAYNNLKTDILKDNIIETYQANLMVGNEQWQQISQDAKIEIEGIYNPETDKIRFFFNQYTDIDVRLLCLICSGRPLEEEDQKIAEEIEANLSALTEAEKQFFALLQIKRSSASSKSHYISIQKKDFAYFLSLIKLMQNKFIIKETNEPLKFIEQEMQLALRIEQINSNNYTLRPILVDELSAWFIGQPVWLFFRNEVRTVRLPFKPKLINALFKGQFTLKKNDLIYFRTIIWKQLNRNKHGNKLIDQQMGQLAI